VEELAPGLYEVLVTEGLKARLDAIAGALPTEQSALPAAEVPHRIAWHLSREVERALSDVAEADRALVGIQVARALLVRLGELVDVDPSALPIDPATVLHAILGRRPDGSQDTLAQPLIPLLDTTQLTNAPGEPNLWNQLRSAVESADRIDVVMAFIRGSGNAPLLEALRRHCELHDHVWLNASELGKEKLTKQGVVAIPLTTTVEGDQEGIRCLQLAQSTRFPEKGIAQRPGKLVDNGCSAQEPLSALWQPRQRLFVQAWKGAGCRRARGEAPTGGSTTKSVIGSGMSPLPHEGACPS
jgi:hypothetical protein